MYLTLSQTPMARRKVFTTYLTDNYLCEYERIYQHDEYNTFTFMKHDPHESRYL